MSHESPQGSPHPEAAPCPPVPESKANTIRDRITGLVRVRASDLLLNPKNWGRHPRAQANALRDLLTEIGYADALLAWKANLDVISNLGAEGREIDFAPELRL